MCGLTGIIDLTSTREIDSRLVARMNEVQRHRGPDEEGIWSEPGARLAHRRLAIIDLANGQQPMFSQDGNFVLVYNGEIYNFRDIRRQLIDLGHSFKTDSDTEVVIYAYAQWGKKCVDHFRGMFALALWDRREKTLFLARDRLGIKPLYYTQLKDGRLAFASELKSLMVIPEVSRELNKQAIEEYFTLGYVPDPKTIFNEVNKLSPGHTLTLTRKAAIQQPEQYWDLAFNNSLSGTEEELQEELVERLREAVRIRLVSEVPLGAFLSGGVDSSAVVALMSELESEPVNTCSIAFGSKDFDESPYAQRVAEHFHTNHLVRKVDADDFDLVDRLVGMYDEPFADSSAMPTYRVCSLARERVTVALSGDGGDEGFAGYRRHRWHMNEEQIRQRIPASIRRCVFGLAGRYYPKLDWAPKVLRAKTTFQAIARNSADAYLHSVSVVPDEIRARMFSHKLNSDLQGYHAREVFRRYSNNAPVDDPLSLVQYLDFKTYLPGDILTKVDRASMANSLEVRVPLLDHEFIDWISKFPRKMKLRNQEGKFIFKKAMEGRLDKEILYRPKMGFAIPISQWFRGALQERLQEGISSTHLCDSGLFDQVELKKLVDQHQSGRWEHASTLWSILMFESFYRQVV